MAELSWKMEYDGYKGIIGLEDAPYVTDAIEMGKSRGIIRDKEWRLRISLDGTEMNLNQFNNEFRVLVANSVAKRIREVSNKSDENIMNLKRRVQEAWGHN